MKRSRQLTFPPFRLDPDNASLWRGHRPVRLTPKAFDVLAYLVEHRGELVTRDALLDAVWSGTVVSQAVLKVCVREIRVALGDRTDTPRFVQTVHRRGYRFIADVAELDARAERPEVSGRPKAEPGLAVDPRYRRPSHLVGREAALDRLWLGLDAAWRGRRQVVFVTGEPGIGKTAVVAAFLERVTADQRVWIAHGQCVEMYGTREPYLPVLEALARLCRAGGGEWLVGELRRLAPTWLVQMPWLLVPGDRDELQRELLGATRERMLREMAEAVEALTAEAPLVLVLEDLQWSDAATLDLLGLLARRQEPAQLLVIATYRPTDVTASPHPLTDLKIDLQLQGRCEDLSLDLLGEPEVMAYLRDRFEGSALPPELARVIHQRTEGNPLFMVSVVDDLVAHGVIAPSSGRWELCAVLEDVELGVPESLRHMIERQLGRLGPDEQRVLEAASASGMEFRAASVAAALAQPPRRVEEWADALARRQLFVRSLGEREWPDRTVTSRYGFIHALHRNTLYQRIPLARRRELHQRIGEREEAGHGARASEVAAELATHFERAGDDSRAGRYLAQAAANATRRHANREAVGYLDRALDIAGRLPAGERAALQLALVQQRGLAHRSMGDVPAAIEDFDRLAREARQQGQAGAEVRALLHLSSALSWIDRDRSLAAVEQALDRAHGLDDEVLEAHVRGYAGVQGILSRGWQDQDAEACRHAIETARRTGDRALLSLHVGHAAYLESHRSEYRAAARTAEEGLDLALEVSDAYHYMTSQFHRGWALLHVGEWGETRRVLSDGLQMAERNEHHLWARAFRFQIAWLLMHAGDFEGARALCLEEAEPTRQPQLGQLLGSIILGFVELGLKKPAAALRAFEGVAAHGAGRPILMDWILQMPLRLGLGESWLARRQFARAREPLEALCRLAARSGERTYLALGRRGLAEAALGMGDAAAADRELSEALGALANREAPLAEWQVCATAARTAALRGQRPRAAEFWARGAAVLDRLGVSIADDPDLRRAFDAHPSVRTIRRAARAA